MHGLEQDGYGAIEHLLRGDFLTFWIEFLRFAPVVDGIQRVVRVVIAG